MKEDYYKLQFTENLICLLLHFLFRTPIKKKQLEILQRQVDTLTDSQNNNDDINMRARSEYSVLKTKYHMLEDQLRDVSI